MTSTLDLVLIHWYPANGDGEPFPNGVSTFRQILGFDGTQHPR